MKKLLIGLVILFILVIAGLSYLGLMPFLSGFIAKQVDLGIKADPAFVTAFESKYGVSNGTGKVSLDVYLSSAEVTSIFAVWEERDKYFPLHNVQIRFNPDGTGEASGFLRVSTAISLAKNLGYSDSDIETGKKYVQYVAGDLPFYVKGTGGMTSNVLSINPSTFQIGRVTVPESITNPVAVAVGDMIERRLSQIGGANIQEANFKSGSFSFVGSVPETIKY
ncbi:MAG: hypothetical protein UW16_C0005G0030 [Microgenomates group bacterium GW2011_GWC1_44_10]|nr:MAG: hypothetical protein UW16_C0005G0030 [Microgenomates group bacterium GW2011_GWC1_44_10]